jgi:2-keto-3-deoxy-L-rhamnonate aldolase RhmA
MSRTAGFRKRMRDGAPTIGTFVKTRDHALTEVLGLSRLDTIVLDGEHAPYDRAHLDTCILAARAADLPCLVRVPSAAPEAILAPLDMGAVGVVVPHVRDVATAEAVARACHYGAGGRGYAGSPRAAGYATKPMADHLRDCAAETTVVAQIEDPEAVEAIDAIAAVEGIDALFIGRVDLTVSYGADSVNAKVVEDAIIRVCQAARQHNRTVGLFLANTDEVAFWIERGVSFFLIGSDHGFVLAGANTLAERFAAAVPR